MNAVYASLVTGGLVALSSVLTLVLNQRHDERRRRMDHEHDHRERLQDKRLATYREFDIAFTRQRRAYDRLATSSVARQLRAQRPDEPPPGPEANAVRNSFDRLNEEWQENLLAALRATEDLQDALGVQLVATCAVYQQAASLVTATRAAWVIQRDLASALGSRREPGPEERQRLQESEAAVEARRDALHSARGIELGLETGRGSEDAGQRP